MRDISFISYHEMHITSHVQHQAQTGCRVDSMSRTALATQSTKSFQRSRRLLLSPTKRKSPSDDEQHIHCPSEKEIWEWTLTSAAVAKCYIRDVLTMSQCQGQPRPLRECFIGLIKYIGFDFYWLGNTPCRKVEVCGVIVGIQVFEKKIMYTSVP